MSTNFVIVQGATFDVTVTVSKNGSVLDLTGYTAQLQARRWPEAAETLLDLSLGAGLTLNAAQGKIRILLTKVQTAAQSGWSDAVYDLFITAPGGEAVRVMDGRLALLKRVTR